MLFKNYVNDSPLCVFGEAHRKTAVVAWAQSERARHSTPPKADILRRTLSIIKIEKTIKLFEYNAIRIYL